MIKIMNFFAFQKEPDIVAFGIGRDVCESVIVILVWPCVSEI